MDRDVNCPYCGHPQDVCHDDGQGYEEGVLHQSYCGVCDKTFGYYTSITFSYEAKKVDCFNGGEHDYQPTKTYPKQFTKMQCQMCENLRQPTHAEKVTYNLYPEISEP